MRVAGESGDPHQGVGVVADVLYALLLIGGFCGLVLCLRGWENL
jgi:hypothetical protein